MGKVESCQVGVFLVYAAKAGYAPLDRQLYLPEDWAKDKARRKECHVPTKVKFREKWQIALDLLDRTLPDLPHGRIAADDEFGRVSQFRAKLRSRKERYILDVPCNTLVRDLEKRRPPRKQAGVGRKREVNSVAIVDFHNLFSIFELGLSLWRSWGSDGALDVAWCGVREPKHGSRRDSATPPADTSRQVPTTHRLRTTGVR